LEITYTELRQKRRRRKYE